VRRDRRSTRQPRGSRYRRCRASRHAQPTLRRWHAVTRCGISRALARGRLQ
jgi:hypothetical protein